MRTVGTGVVVLGLLAALLPAGGQAEPNGLKVGEGRVHPYFDLVQSYDSAAGYFSVGQGRTPTLSGELVTHFRPGFRLELANPNTLVDLSGNVDYVLYTGLVTPGSQSASRLQGEANIGAAFNKSGPVEVQLSDRLIRSDRTHNPSVAVGALSLFNEAKLALPIRPGGGALEISPSATFSFELFDTFSAQLPPGCPASSPGCDPQALAANNYTNLGAGLEGRWRFLPKTALVLGASYDWRGYSGGQAQLLRATAGLAGLLSPKVTTVLRAGYSQDFAGGAATVVGQAEVGYLMSETASLRLGYLRTLNPVAIYGVFGDDRGYLDSRFLLGGKLTLLASAAFDFLTYYSKTNPRSESGLTLNLGPEYQFKPWLIGGLGYTFMNRNSTPAYSRHEGFARLTITY